MRLVLSTAMRYRMRKLLQLCLDKERCSPRPAPQQRPRRYGRRLGAPVSQPGRGLRLLCRRGRRLGRERRNRHLLRARLCGIGRENCVRRNRSRPRRRNERASGRATQFRQMIGSNLHDGADRQLPIELGDIRRFHPNAAVAGRPSNVLFLGGSMDVNAPIVGVRVSRLQSAQPDDPSNDWIPARRIGRQNFTGEPAVMENRADWSVITNFFSNLEHSQRSRH